MYEGYLGNLELKVPWTNLKHQPVVVTISDLFILAGPKSFSDVSAKEQADIELKNKRERLETSEMFALDSGTEGNAASQGTAPKQPCSSPPTR